MKKSSFIIVVVAILLVLCLPVSALAAGELTPRRALIYGALINTTTSTSRAAVVYQVNSTDFTLKPTADMSAVNQISLFFVVPTTVTTFSLSISCLDSRLSQISDGSFSTNTALYNWENGAPSNVSYISGVARNKTTVDGLGTYTWDYYTTTSSNRNCIMVNLPLNITVVDDSYFYNFRVNYLNVNGQAIEDIAVTEYNAEFEDTISELAQNEERMWAQVIAPDLTDTFDRIQQQNNSTYSDYKTVIASVSVDNFLIPGLLMIVFSFAFYSYVVFGRKG